MATVMAERVPDEPIIIARIAGQATYADLKDMFRQALDLAKDIRGTAYRIDDFSKAKTSLDELIKAIREISRGAQGSAGDVRWTVLMVGKTTISQLGADLLRQTAELHIPRFATVEAALEHARFLIAQSAQEHGAEQNASTE